MSTVTEYEPRTYRGADLDELLPKIRAELGADAIVVRQREGLGGGVGGFFQRRCVEVVARRGRPGLDAYDGRDAPSAPSAPTPTPTPALSAPAPPAPFVPEPPAPAIREIMRVASPFVEQLHAAEVAAASVHADEPASHQIVDEQRVTGAYGTSAYAMSADGSASVRGRPGEHAVFADEPVGRRRSEPAPERAGRAGRAGRAPEYAGREPQPAGREPEPIDLAEPAERGRAAAAHERALLAAGIAPQLVTEVIDATISHAMPFGSNRALKHVVRDALARRIPLTPPVAAGGKAIAFVGAGGSGKTLCAARIATAYAHRSDLGVTVMSLATPAHRIELGGLLDAGTDVLDASAVVANCAFGDGMLTVVDTPAVSPSAVGEVRALANALKRLGRPEVHVAVPATLSSAAVRALLDGLAALRPTAIVLTHLDEVAHAGPVVDEAIARGIAISYTSDGSAADGFAPADPAALAARMLA